MCNDDLCKYLNLQYNALYLALYCKFKYLHKSRCRKSSQGNDDFKNAKIFKIYEDLSNTRDVVYIGSICDTLSKCMSKFRIKLKS